MSGITIVQEPLTSDDTVAYSVFFSAANEVVTPLLASTFSLHSQAATESDALSTVCRRSSTCVSRTSWPATSSRLR